jgi:hypothetical protein
MLRSEFMSGLVKDNNLYREEDLFELKFGSRSTWIIKRQGIEKIQFNNGIVVKFDWIRMEKDYAVVKATATKGDVVIETYGSAWHGDGGNCKSNYVAEMAEKRALSRVVLKAIGAYKFSIYGEDESDDFKEKSK